MIKEILKLHLMNITKEIKIKIKYLGWRNLPLFLKVGGFMFTINGIKWSLMYVPSYSDLLMRSDGSMTVGVTDWNTKTIYLSKSLRGAFMERVLCHELCHCICFSYEIKLPIRTEEYLCDFMSLYGKEIIYLLDDLLMVIQSKSA